MSIPESMKALVVESQGKVAIKDVPIPTLGPKDVLVRVEYVALNPVDTAQVDYVPRPGSILGIDFVGTIAVSNDSKHQVGETVCGLVHGGTFPDVGAFAEYLKVEGPKCIKAPDGWKAEDLVAVPATLTTAMMCVFLKQGNEFPPAKRAGNDWLLVSGGSTSVGSFIIQLAKLVGYRVIVTASPHSFDLVKSFGADHAVDYHDVDKAVAEILDVTGGGVIGAVDCGGGVGGAKICVGAMKPEGGILNTLLPPPPEVQFGPEIRFDNVDIFTIGGYEFAFAPGGPSLPPMLEIKDWFDNKVVLIIPDLLTKYHIKGPRVNVRHGLDNVHTGLDDLRAGRVSGEKLVYKIA